MKKNLLFVILLMTISQFSTLNAQKVKVKGYDVDIKFLDLPSEGFAPSITTYNIKLEGDLNGLKALNVTESDIINRIQINGYPKSTENVGAQVIVDLTGPTGGTLKMESKKYTPKDAKEYYQYYYSTNFQGSIKYSVYDENHVLLTEDIISYSSTEKSSEYKSKALLKKGFDSSKFYLSNRNSKLNSLINSLNSVLNSKFGYSERTGEESMAKNATKKHPEYDEYKPYEEMMTNAFSKLTPYSNAEYKEAIQPAIDFWTSKEPTYSASDKNEKKLKYLCQNNLAIAYLYTEEYDKANEYAKLIAKGEYKEKQGNKLSERVESITSQLEKLGRPSRFFKIELSEEDKIKTEEAVKARAEAIASGDILSFPKFDQTLNVKTESTIAPTTIFIKNGNSQNGYLVYEETYMGRPDFRKPHNLRFGFASNGQIETGTLAYAKLDSFLIDSIMYDVKDITINAGLSRTLKNAVIETLDTYETGEIQLIFPPFLRAGGILGGDEDLEAELVVQFTGEEDPRITKGFLKGFNSVMKSMFKDCSEAMDYLEASSQDDNLIKKLSSPAIDAKVKELNKLMEMNDNCSKS